MQKPQPVNFSKAGMIYLTRSKVANILPLGVLSQLMSYKTPPGIADTGGLQL